MTYKNHLISKYYLTGKGIFWVVDKDLSKAYSSGKDAKAGINGQRTRWACLDLSNVKEDCCKLAD